MKQENQILSLIGARIKAIREALGLTQKELAQALNISGPSLSEFENGKHYPNFDLIYHINREYNVNLYYLLYGEGEMFEERGGPLIKRIDRLARENPDVAKLLNYFARSLVVRYYLLSQFNSKMLTEGSQIEREIIDLKETHHEKPFPD
jgi:transcriptional regulator with XRE-family HTH domain